MSNRRKLPAPVKIKRSRFSGNVLPVAPREADRVADLIARQAPPAWRCVECFLSDCTRETPTPGCENCDCEFCASR